MNKQKTYDKISSDEFAEALGLAKKYYNEETNSGRLASNLIILNVLELLLNMFIDYLHNKITINNITNKKNNSNYVAYTGKDEPSTSNKNLTLGQKIAFIDERYIFPKKDEYIKLLNSVNQARKKAVHNMFESGLLKSESKLSRNSGEVFIKSNKAIETSFYILESLYLN